MRKRLNPEAEPGTITPADERFFREMLGRYKMKSDSLEQKIQNSFLVPKKAAYILIVILLVLFIIL